MSQRTIDLVETTLKEFQPFLDSKTTLEQPLTFYHNGDRGIHHTMTRCGDKNSRDHFRDKTVLTLTNALNKRICPYCLERGIKVQLLSGGQALEHLQEIQNQISRREEQLAEKSVTIRKLFEFYEFALALDAKLLETTHEQVQKEGLTNFAQQIRINADKFITCVKSNFLAQQEKVEQYIVAQSLSLQASNERFTLASSEDTLLFAPNPERYGRRNAVTQLFELWINGKSAFQTNEVIKLNLEEHLDKVPLSLSSQLTGVKIPDQAEDLKAALDIGWALAKKEALDRMLSRWEARYTKELSQRESKVALIYEAKLWKAEEVRILLPYFQVATSPKKDYTLLRVPSFISKWLELQNSNSSRYGNSIVSIFTDLNYDQNVLEAALVLYQPDDQTIYSDFGRALKAASLL